jgi:hypothetical protein
VAESETAARLRSLLERLEEVRGRLERAESADEAVDLLQDLSELAKETQAEIERARREEPRSQEAHDAAR